MDISFGAVFLFLFFALMFGYGAVISMRERGSTKGKSKSFFDIAKEHEEQSFKNNQEQAAFFYSKKK